MERKIFIFLSAVFFCISAIAEERGIDNRYISKNFYKNIYPSTLNKSISETSVKAPMKEEKKESQIIATEDKVIKGTKNDSAKTQLNTFSNVVTKSAPVTSMKRKIVKRPILARNIADEKDQNVTKTEDEKDSEKNQKISEKEQSLIKEPVKSNSKLGMSRQGTKSGGMHRIVSRVENAHATTARSGTRNQTTSQSTKTNKTKNARRIISRSAVRSGSSRSSGSTSSATGQSVISSQQCFADYKECMDRYCERTDTAYNRCYCSAKLAQIDSKYQNKIDSLIQDIIKLQYDADVSEEELMAYWNTSVGSYTDTNPWLSIDNALNIDWASTESRVRGQNAFTTGHSYCVNYLKACSYMESNLRDAYRSEIARDCSIYEKGLSRIQMAAESVIQSYSD